MLSCTVLGLVHVDDTPTVYVALPSTGDTTHHVIVNVWVHTCYIKYHNCEGYLT